MAFIVRRFTTEAVRRTRGDFLMNDWLQFALGAGAIMLGIAALTWAIRSTALISWTAREASRSAREAERSARAAARSARK